MISGLQQQVGRQHGGEQRRAERRPARLLEDDAKLEHPVSRTAKLRWHAQPVHADLLGKPGRQPGIAGGGIAGPADHVGHPG